MHSPEFEPQQRLSYIALIIEWRVAAIEIIEVLLTVHTACIWQLHLAQGTHFPAFILKDSRAKHATARKNNIQHLCAQTFEHNQHTPHNCLSLTLRAVYLLERLKLSIIW